MKWISPTIWKSLFGFVVGLTLSLAGTALARPPALSLKTPTDGAALQLSADRLNYLPQKAKILLSGNVRLTAGSLSTGARTMVVLLDAQSQPFRLDATGGFHFSLKSVASGKARRGSLLLREQRLVLSGSASVSLEKGLELQGQRISIDLHSRRVTVHRARARLHLEGS